MWIRSERVKDVTVHPAFRNAVRSVAALSDGSPKKRRATMPKCSIDGAGLAVFPRSCHTINLEEPELFNRTVVDFLTSVEAGFRGGATKPFPGTLIPTWVRPTGGVALSVDHD